MTGAPVPNGSSGDAAANREAARRSDGKFGVQPHAEADLSAVDLTGGQPQAPTDTADTSADLGPVYVADAEDFLDWFEPAEYDLNLGWEGTEGHPAFLEQNPFNPERVWAATWDDFCADVATNGITEPVVVDAETNELIEGHHRVVAAWKAGQPIRFRYQGGDMDDFVDEGLVTREADPDAPARPAPRFDPSADPVLGSNPPMRRFNAVQHVGDLNPAERADWSYEGEGLSVSVDADDWAQIAKLPGDTWSLTRPDGAPLALVSYRDLDPHQRDEVRQWGRRNGWMETRTVHRVSVFDDELDDWVNDDFDTAEEAREHLAEAIADGEMTQDGVAEVTVWRPTEAFPDSRVPHDGDASDVLLAHWVRTERPDLDGVWWEDRYSPETLSCPRGVLVHDLSWYRRERA